MGASSADCPPQPSEPKAGSTDGGAERPGRVRRLRIVLVVVLFVGLLVAGRVTGLNERFEVEQIRETVLAAGPWGMVLLVVLFAAGELVHVPGLVFVGAAVLVYGSVAGTLLGFAGALVSVTVSFFVVRTVGGQPLGELRNRWLRRIMARLDERPVLTVALLRLVLWMAPALNYALALTNVRYRDYLVGSALGLVIPLAGAGVVFHWLFY